MNTLENKHAHRVSELLQSWMLLPRAMHQIDKQAPAKDYASRMLRRNFDSKETNRIFSASLDGSEWLAGLRKLDWDSDFFGFGVGKIEPLMFQGTNEVSEKNILAGTSFVNGCIEEAKKMALQQLSCAVHTADTICQIALQRNNFFAADTIVSYELDLTCGSRTPIAPWVRLVQDSDIQQLRKISGDCFSNRRFNVNRFNSDPQFSNESVRRLYETWIQNSVTGALADVVYVAELDGSVAGFITAKVQEALGSPHGTIPLNAVHPDFHNRGIYKALVEASLQWLISREIKTVEIRTQLPNSAVHRTWQRLGAQIAASYHTFHLDLSKSNL